MSDRITVRDGRELIIRGSGPGDGPRVHAYIQALGLSTEFILTHAEDIPELSAVEERIEMIAHRRFYSLVAIDPELDQVVANSAYTFSPRKKLQHVVTLGTGVLPAWQGVGLGSIMLQRSIDDMKADPRIHKIELTAMLGNDRAISLYERAGFVVEGRKTRSIRQPNGEFRDEILMGLWLGEV